MSYWDSSALLEVLAGHAPALAAFEADDARITRPHTLAEVFSHLTGGRMPVRLSANDAAAALAAAAARLELLDLAPDETLRALASAQRRGVRGGAVHDYLHVVAAERHHAQAIVTYNTADFRPLTRLPLLAP